VGLSRDKGTPGARRQTLQLHFKPFYFTLVPTMPGTYKGLGPVEFKAGVALVSESGRITTPLFILYRVFRKR